MKQPDWLKPFLQESLNIEDVWREPTEEELLITWDFIQKDIIELPDLLSLVSVYQKDAVLRDTPSKRVWIGGREAPLGGLALVGKLGNLLWRVSQTEYDTDPWEIHTEYERLHPFTDGNGRSGRALWANVMYKQGYDFRYKFLQMFYYQTLDRYSEETLTGA